MVNINWCLKQKKGIELVEPNDNLSEAYLKEAKETLMSIPGKGDKWETIMAYYSCYNALYSILMKAGIKCEIHDCSIELMNLISGFSKEDYSFMLDLKSKRIDNQYYLKKEKISNFNLIKNFVLKCEQLSLKLDINKIRKKLK